MMGNQPMLGGQPMMGNNQHMMGNNMGGGFGVQDNYRPRNYSPPRRRFRSVSLYLFRGIRKAAAGISNCRGIFCLSKIWLFEWLSLDQSSPDQLQFINIATQTSIVLHWYQQKTYACEMLFEEEHLCLQYLQQRPKCFQSNKKSLRLSSNVLEWGILKIWVLSDHRAFWIK